MLTANVDCSMAVDNITGWTTEVLTKLNGYSRWYLNEMTFKKTSNQITEITVALTRETWFE